MKLLLAFSLFIAIASAQQKPAEPAAAPAQHVLTDKEASAAWNARSKALEADLLATAATTAIDTAKKARVAANALAAAFDVCGKGNSMAESPDGNLVCIAAAASK
jgi:hypothetical protein